MNKYFSLVVCGVLLLSARGDRQLLLCQSPAYRLAIGLSHNQRWGSHHVEEHWFGKTQY